MTRSLSDLPMMDLIDLPMKSGLSVGDLSDLLIKALSGLSL